MSNLSKLRLTVLPNGSAGFFVDDQAEIVTGNTTVVIGTDSGHTFISENGDTFTMPSIATGNVVTFVNMAGNGAEELTIDPAAADGITYLGSSTDGVTLINTQATSRKGDYVTLASQNQTVAWQVVAVRGIWAKGA